MSGINPRSSLAERFYAVLQHVMLPAGFRRDVGVEMRETFRDRHRALRGAGRLTGTTFWLRTMRDLLATSADAWRETLVGEDRFPDLPRRTRPMAGLGRDLAYVLRGLRRAPAFTLFIVITLALGIGANTAIFSVINAVLLAPLPFADPDRLVAISRNDRPGKGASSFSYPDYADVREWTETVTAMAAFRRTSATITEEEPERVRLTLVDPGFVDVLGVRPLLGRGFTPEERVESGATVIVLSHGLWQRRFQGDPSVVGTTISIGRQPFLIVGVMPAGFGFPERTEAWLPMPPDGNRGQFWLDVVGRLAGDADVASATAELSELLQRLEIEYPGRYVDNAAIVQPLSERLVGGVRSPLLILFGAVAFVLLIACANVANLLLVRASGRCREFAVRSALGASRGRLVRLSLLESLVLSLLGAAGGIGIAAWARTALVAAASATVPRLGELRLDLRVLAFAVVAAVLTSLVVGFAPAARGSRLAPRDGLSGAARSASDGSSAAPARDLLIVTEVALAVVLLVGAGLMVRSIQRMLDTETGFERESVYSAFVDLPATHYDEDAEIVVFFRQLEARVEASPLVEAAGLVWHLPFGGGLLGTRLMAQDLPVLPRPDRLLVNYNIAGPGYFETMGIPVLAGRDFDDTDVADGEPVAVITASLATSFWPGESALGKRITSDDQDDATWTTVVGVVGDVRNRGLFSPPREEVYRSYRQLTPNGLDLIIRSSADARTVHTTIGGIVHDLDPALALQFRRLDDIVADSISRQSLYAKLLGLFSGLAVLLSAIGLYGVIAYSVRHRTYEFGLRMAVGARRREILRLVTTQGLKIALVGVLAGMGAALALGRVLSSLLYEISPSDPATFLLVSFGTLVLALAASAVPAIHASRIEPAAALRGPGG